MPGPGLGHASLAAALAAALIVPSAASGDGGLSVRLQPQFDASETTSTDVTGRTSHESATAFTNRYFVDLNRQLFPLTTFSGNGMYESVMGSSTINGISSQTESDRWNLYGQLKVGDPILNGTAAYTRASASASALAGGIASFAPTTISDNYTLLGAWRTEDLPRVDLRLSRIDQYDSRRQLADLSTNEAYLSARYDYQYLNTSYRFLYSNPVDHLHGTDTTGMSHTAMVGFGDRFLEDRLTLGANYQIQGVTTDTSTSGRGTVATQQIPSQGLSAVETFPIVPTRVTLDPNPGLVDGDATVGAGINIGFGPSVANDQNYRDLGAQFPNAVTPVNAIYVYVDRLLAANVAGAFSWAAYRSDDNLDWVSVPLAGAVQFGTFQNRFEIPIAKTQARYVKVIVKPLAASATSDPRYRDILVTEVQFLDLESAASVSGKHSSFNGVFNGTARVLLLRSSPTLYYEFSTLLTHDSRRQQTLTFDIINAVSLEQRLARPLVLRAGVERLEADEGAGHESQTRYTAALSYQPLPLLNGSMAYAGQTRQTAAGTSSNNTFLVIGRADPYQGISLGTNLSFGFGTDEERRDFRTATAQVSTSLVPNRFVTVTGAYTVSDTVSTFGGTQSSTTSMQLDGFLSFTPFTALLASVNGSRVLSRGRWYTLANVNAGLSPFSGGQLVMTFVYTDTIDTGADSRLRTFGPTIRWNLRPGTYAEVSYSVSDSSDRAADRHVRAVMARLFVPLI